MICPSSRGVGSELPPRSQDIRHVYKAVTPEDLNKLPTRSSTLSATMQSLLPPKTDDIPENASNPQRPWSMLLLAQEVRQHSNIHER